MTKDHMGEASHSIEQQPLSSSGLNWYMAGTIHRILASPTGWVVIDGEPGKCTGIGRNSAIDQIANPPKRMSRGCEERTSVQDHQGIEPFFDRPPEQHWHDQKDRTEKSHAPFPGCKNMLWLQQIILHQIGLLNNEIETHTHQTSHKTPSHHLIGLISVKPMRVFYPRINRRPMTMVTI